MMIAIVISYLAVMLGIGWWCGRSRITGMTDFLLAGRRLGLVMCAGAMAATHFGGGALLGGTEYGFTYGLSGAWYGFSTGIGLALLGLFTAKKFRALALYTVPDYLEARYGGRVIRLLGALLSVVALVGILAAQVKAAGGACALIGLNHQLAPVLAVAVFVAYTAMGGLWAATVSDLVQIVIAAVGVVAAVIVVVIATGDQGGMESLLQQKGIGEAYFSFFGEGPSFIVWLLLPTVMYTLIGQDFYQRLFAAKDAVTARTAALTGGAFLIAISAGPAVIGMGARALADPSLSADQAFPWVLRELMNPIVGGVILAAVLAAIMSTADSLLTAATSHVVNDIMVGTLATDRIRDERRLLRTSRIVTVIVGGCALLIGVTVPGIVRTLIYSYTMYTAGVLVPVLGGVLWKRATRAGALAAIAAGSVVALAGITTGLDIGGVPTEVYAAGGSAVVFVVVSLATSPPQS